MSDLGQEVSRRNTWPMPVLVALASVGSLAALAAAGLKGAAILATAMAASFVLHGCVRALPFGKTTAERALLRSIYWVPLLAPVVALPQLRSGLTFDWPPAFAMALGAGIGVALSLLFLYPSRHIFVDRDLRDLVIPRSNAADLALALQSMAGAAVFEEVFFRYAIYTLIQGPGTFLVISVIMFVLSHYCLPWASREFRPSDYTNQLLAGLTLGSLYLATGSLAACIIAHLIFNLSRLAPSILRNFDNLRHTHGLHDS